jgi:hypothetical protein
MCSDGAMCTGKQMCETSMNGCDTKCSCGPNGLYQCETACSGSVCPAGAYHVGDMCTDEGAGPCQCETSQSGPTQQCTCEGGVWNACPLTMPTGPCSIPNQTCEYGNFASCTCTTMGWECAL